ncbi:hypothetical protein [Methylotuvimicrobium sp. KM1]|uniref:hypothetical protein n=1 Tax=Methylotuvimicrobium sp. KM1 TaxID=3377707 RepID=UPI00384D1BA1
MSKMRIIPEISSASIVLTGDFNPKIFHPLWFSNNKILTQDEAEKAEVEIMHPEIAIFETEWVKVRVEKKRFVAESTMPPLIRVCDFVVDTFGNFLNHTPIGRVGINRSVHFRLDDQSKIDRLGKSLAPQTAWGEWGDQIEGPSSGDKHGGLRMIIMEQRNLDDRYRGHIQAKVEPSKSMLNGVIVDINDHYEVEDCNNVIGCEKIISIVKNNFEKSIKRSDWIIDQVMALTE